MSDKYSDRMLAIAQSEDTYDLLNHIAWTDVIRPRLEKQVTALSSILVAEALGTPIAGGQSREQIAGMCYGIRHMISLFEEIMRKGEKALADLNSAGVALKD